MSSIWYIFLYISGNKSPVNAKLELYCFTTESCFSDGAWNRNKKHRKNTITTTFITLHMYINIVYKEVLKTKQGTLFPLLFWHDLTLT